MADHLHGLGVQPVPSLGVLLKRVAGRPWRPVLARLAVHADDVGPQAASLHLRLAQGGLQAARNVARSMDGHGFHAAKLHEQTRNARTLSRCAAGLLSSRSPQGDGTSRRLLLTRPAAVDAAYVYGIMRSDPAARGHLIGNNDLWIAAHAKSVGLTVVTNSRSEFSIAPLHGLALAAATARGRGMKNPPHWGQKPPALGSFEECTKILRQQRYHGW